MIQLNLFGNPTKPKEYSFCKVCGRRLTNPKSRKKGVGVVCERKLRGGRW